jgi:hypothetical protein
MGGGGGECVCIYICIYVYLVPFQIENGRWKPRQFSFCPLTVCSSCKWNFFGCPFVDKETKGIIRLKTDLAELPIYDCK